MHQQQRQLQQQVNSRRPTSSRERLAPEFGVIRVKKEPGLEEEDEDSPIPASRVSACVCVPYKESI